MSTASDNSAKRVLFGEGSDSLETWVELSGDQKQEDEEFEKQPSVRPDLFGDYVGQEAIKENVLIACGAAKQRGDALDHLLLHGPPGLGKTSLARVVAQELDVGFKSTSGPVIERPGDLAAILTTLTPRDILFIDEIHRLPRVIEEVLYPAMEDFQLDILIGQGPAAKSVKIELKPFTLIGATTRSGMLTSPLRDRFGIIHRLKYYNESELAQIVRRSAAILGIAVDEEASVEIGRRSRGTPRIANRLLRRVRDFAEQRADGKINRQVTNDALVLLGIDDKGLDTMDRKFLEVIIDKFQGGPVGIETIAAALGEEKGTIEDVYEPYLLQEGYIARTRRGREVTALGFSALNRTPIAKSVQTEAF